MGTMPSWYTNMYKKAASMGGAQTYMPANQMKKSSTAVQKLQGIVGNNPGQTPAPGASLPKAYNQLQPAQNDVYTPSNIKLAPKTGVDTAPPAYTPGSYTAGAAPTYNYTPSQRATLEEMMTRATGMLKGQWDAENVGYDNQLANIKTSLANIINGYNAQYANDEATANKNLQKDLKTNLESSNARGMFWSTIPDIQATELEKNNQDNLTQLKNIINSNIGQATNTAQTNEAGVLNMKAALAGKYGSAAQQLAQQMLDSDNATKDSADNRALEKFRVDSGNYNESENRNTTLFTNSENRKADLQNAEANRKSAESIADKDRISKEEQSELDRLQSKYATDKNSLTQIEIQKMSALEQKANRDADWRNAEANRKADKANTNAQIAANKYNADQNNATQLAAARISAAGSRAASGSAVKELTPQQLEDKKVLRSAILKDLNTGFATTYSSLKKPTSNSDWQSWEDAYQNTLSQLSPTGGIHEDYQGDARAAFQNSQFFKAYNTYKAQWAPKAGSAKAQSNTQKPTQTKKAPAVPAGGYRAAKAPVIPKGNTKSAVNQLIDSIRNSGAFFPPANKADTKNKKTSKK